MIEYLFELLRSKLSKKGVVFFALIGIVATTSWIAYTFFTDNTKHSFDTYYDLKSNLCVRAVDSTAKMATSNDPNEIKKAAAEFDELYWGKLVLIEDKVLEGAMVEYRKLISDPKDQLNGELQLDDLANKRIDRRLLRRGSLLVSQACFDLIQPQWIDQVIAVFRTPSKVRLTK